MSTQLCVIIEDWITNSLTTTRIHNGSEWRWALWKRMRNVPQQGETHQSTVAAVGGHSELRKCMKMSANSVFLREGNERSPKMTPICS